MAANHSTCPVSVDDNRPASLGLARAIADRSAAIESLLDDLPLATLGSAADTVGTAETRLELAGTLLALAHAERLLTGIVRRETARFDRLGRPELVAAAA